MGRYLKNLDPNRIDSIIRSRIEEAIEANARGEHAVLHVVPGTPCFSISWEMQQQIDPQRGIAMAHVHTGDPAALDDPFWLDPSMRGSTIEQVAERGPLLLMVASDLEPRLLLDRLGDRTVMVHDLSDDLTEDLTGAPAADRPR